MHSKKGRFMNKQQYDRYCQAVQDFFESEGIKHLPSCSDDAFFSWRACDCCKRPLGGMRHKCGEYSICYDCIYFDAYGRLDDATMIAIENSGN